MITQQIDFTGGLDLLTADTQLANNEYRWLINARNRFGPIEPNRKHIKLKNIPPGQVQGLIGIGATLILFVSGQAFYYVDGNNDANGNPLWTLIIGFQMDPLVQQYYTCAVPASFKDFIRKSATNIAAPITLTQDFKVEGTPAGVVVQDGINQPWFIQFDIVNQIFIARVLGTYDTWANINLDASNREYVPIGLQMAYVSGKLLIAKRDGTGVYQSITGRPLDFMVITDTNGNKLPKVSDGGADRIAYGFDFDIINALIPCNVPDSFWVGTAHNLRIITFDYTRTVYGEPLFNVSAIFKVGVVNQFSLIETLGDFASIDFDGVKSMNAAQSLKFRGRNNIFSLNVSKLFRTSKSNIIKQQTTAAVQFDNYLLFSVDTRYGNLILCYDNILNKWTSFDITLIKYIKQFATIEIPTQTKLYCITQDNSVWYMFGDTKTETAIVRTKSFVRTDLPLHYEGRCEHKGQMINLLFDGATYSGHVTLIEMIDEQENIQNKTEYSRDRKPLNVTLPGINYPVRMPVVTASYQGVNSPTFALREGLTGKKLSYIFIWDNDSRLIEFEMISQDIGEKITQRQKQETYDGTIKN